MEGVYITKKYTLRTLALVSNIYVSLGINYVSIRRDFKGGAVY